MFVFSETQIPAPTADGALLSYHAQHQVDDGQVFHRGEELHHEEQQDGSDDGEREKEKESDDRLPVEDDRQGDYPARRGGDEDRGVGSEKFQLPKQALSSMSSLFDQVLLAKGQV